MAAADKTRIGAQLRKERKERGWDVPQMAHELAKVLTGPRVDHASLVSYVWRWEAGKYTVSERYRLGYAAALDKDESELFGIEEDPVPPAVGSLPVTDARTPLDNDMQRRVLLMLAGLGAVPWPAAESLRSALTNIASDSVADWRATVAEHGTTMLVTPRSAILSDLLTDLNDVNALLDAGHPEQKALLEVAAALSTFVSMVTYDAGYLARAFRWWRTAQQLADESGYAPLRAYVRARRGLCLLYGRRNTGQALALAEEAIRLSEGRSSIGLTEAHALRAAALADQGNPQAGASLDHMVRTAEQMPEKPESFAPLGFDGNSIRSAQTATYVKLGNGKAALRAGQTEPTPWTQLFVAAAMTQVGKADDALHHAVTTLNGLDETQNRFSVRQKAQFVLAALPDKARALPAAKELRALTAGPLR